MTADLAEEHSTATLAAERLENEQAERIKLEKDKQELQVRKRIQINIQIFKLILFIFLGSRSQFAVVQREDGDGVALLQGRGHERVRSGGQ